MMKKHFKLGLVALILMHLMFDCGSINASAAEPSDEAPSQEDAVSMERPLYTDETRPDFPVFNSVEGEENFLSIIDSDGVVAQSGGEALELKLNQEYEVRISYCNDGLPTGIPTYANANDTRVCVDFPFTISSEQKIIAMITAANSQPLTVSATLTLVASEPMNLEIVRGTMRMVNDDPTNNSLLGYDDLFGDGALIGTNSMTGIVLHGPENAGYVVFKFRTLPFDQSTIASLGNQSVDEIILDQEPKPQLPDQEAKLTKFVTVLLVILVLTIVVSMGYFFYKCRSSQ